MEILGIIIREINSNLRVYDFILNDKRWIMNKFEIDLER